MVKKVLFMAGGVGGPGVPVRNGLVAEYRFDECRNLLKYSQQFDNAAHRKTRATVSANAAVSPEGTATANCVVEDATAANTHHIYQNLGTDLPANADYVLSVYAKKGDRIWFALSDKPKSAAGARYSFFNLDAGAIGTVDAAHTASIVPLNGGWYRCSIKFNSGVGVDNQVVYPVRLAEADNDITFSGDPTTYPAGIYIWGAQLEAGSAATTYVPTTDKQTLTDYSGNANHGTLGSTAGADTNDPTWTGNGQYLTTDDYDILGGVSEFALSNYTICVVWNPNTADTAGVLLSKNTAAATGAGNKGFILAQTATGTGDLTLSQFDSDGGGTLHTVSSASTPAAATWHYSVAACDGTTLYLSAGQAAALTAGATTLTAAAANTVKELHLGRYAHDASGYFAGSIAYLAVYNRKLAQAEIAKNYAYLKSHLKRQRGISLA